MSLDLSAVDVFRMGVRGPRPKLRCGIHLEAPIAAFTFGNRLNDDKVIIPGPINAAIAWAAIDASRISGQPVYAQHEVSEALGPHVPVKRSHNRDPETGMYITTEDYAISIAAHLQEMKEDPLVNIAAHFNHVGRCAYELNKVGVEVAGFIPNLPKSFDDESNEVWTRGLGRWTAHEVGACGLIALSDHFPQTAERLHDALVDLKHWHTTGR